MKKIKILLTFGGASFEHNASIISASNIIGLFDSAKYEVMPLLMTENNGWLLCDANKMIKNSDDASAILKSLSGTRVFLRIGNKKGEIITVDSNEQIGVDAVFPVLTGKRGCDGEHQGLWQAAGIPYTGPSIIGAAIGFDKDVMKRLLKQADIPVCHFQTFDRHILFQQNYYELIKIFDTPFFMKPANSGSSIGVYKISSEHEFLAYRKEIFQYDAKVLIEENINGSELELYCIKVGQEIKTTIIRQTIIENGFFSFEQKYFIDDVIKNVPAKISTKIQDEVQQLTRKAYNVLEGRGLARMDFFYSAKGELYLNEINTAPVFMSHTGQPPLWELSGVSYRQLIDWIIGETLNH